MATAKTLMRGVALVSAIGIGAYLVVSAQRGAAPGRAETADGARRQEPLASPARAPEGADSEGAATGAASAEHGLEQPDEAHFLHGSKSGLLDVETLFPLPGPDEQGAPAGVLQPAVDPVFLPSSKSLRVQPTPGQP